MDVVNQIIPLRIKAMREARNMTQSELAKRMGVTPASVSLWEANKKNPALSNLFRLVCVLECSISDLFPPT